MTDETRAARDRDLRQILQDRREELRGELRTRIRDARTDRGDDVFDEVDHSDATMQEGIGFALMQMKAETLARLDEALVRLDIGEFGFCFECHAEISPTRLRALPFAVRCKDCEERREQRLVRERKMALSRTAMSPYVDLGG
ncbi:MAG: TraR/DksA family transcriptional regulator [Polyangiales bacterium]